MPASIRPAAAQRNSSPRDAQPSAAGIPLVAAGAILLLTVVAYLPVLRAGYIWDDDDYITRNETLRSVDGLRQIWLVPRALPQYYPLVHTTFWCEYHLWGLSPYGYHVVNVLLHATSALLLWRLLLRLRVPGAWWAAAIFAVHPVMVESAAWITERKNVLSLTLALAALHAYLRFEPLAAADATPASPNSSRWRWYALALVLFVAALLSKTVVATLPAVIVVLMWWRRGALRRHDLIPLIPFFALGIALGLTTAWLERYHVGAVGDDWSLTPVQRLLLAGRVLWFYAGKLAFPYPLAFFYPRFVIDDHALWQYLFPLATVTLIAGLWWQRARLGRGPLAAVLIFAGVLFPALGFFDVYPFRYSFVADHFQYHASIALIALVSAGAGAAAARFSPQGRIVCVILATLLLTALAVMTFRQAGNYQNLEALYRDTIHKNPGGWVAYMNLSTELETQDRFDEALPLAREAARLKPDEPAVHSNLGSTLLNLGESQGFAPGQLEEITTELDLALQLAQTRPGLSRVSPVIHYNLAIALVKLGERDGYQPGQLERAIEHLHEALRMNPEYVGAHSNLASVFVAQQRLTEAAAHLSRALEIEPENVDTLVTMGNTLSALGKVDEARASFERALATDPQRATAHYGLALLLLGQGASQRAGQHLQSALQTNPRLAEAHYALAGVVAGQGNLPGAKEHYQKAIELRPHYDRAWNNLGVVQMNLGETDQAIHSFEEATCINPDYAEAKANLERARQVKDQKQQPPEPGNR